MTRSRPPVLKRACPSGSSAATLRRVARRRSISEDLHPRAVARDETEDARAAGRAKHTDRVLGSVRATQVQRSRRSCPQRREGHQSARIERGRCRRIVEKQEDMGKQVREANGHANNGVDASDDVQRANSVAIAVYVHTHDERASGGIQQQCDIGGSSDRLRTGECETTREVARCADCPAVLDTGTELRNRRGGKYCDEAGSGYALYERVTARCASARRPRAARRAPATRHVCYSPPFGA